MTKRGWRDPCSDSFNGALVDVERLIGSVYEFGLPSWEDTVEAAELEEPINSLLP